MIAQFTNHPWPGDTAYLFHVLIDDQSVVKQVGEVQERFDFPKLVPLAADEFHITVVPIAFEGFVDDVQLQAIAGDAVQLTKEVASEVVALGPVVVDEDQVVLLANPCNELRHLREVLRASVERRLMSNAMPSPDNFRPHVSMFYSAGEHPTEPVERVASAINPGDISLSINTISLVKVRRAESHYRNEVLATFSLAPN
jgi:2'-5' RNA ligase